MIVASTRGVDLNENEIWGGICCLPLARTEGASALAARVKNSELVLHALLGGFWFRREKCEYSERGEPECE
jgi:hypothetical protein